MSYIYLPQKVMELDTDAQIVLANITQSVCNKTGKASISLQRLQAKTKMRRADVCRTIETLEQNSLMEISKETRSNNVYLLPWHPCVAKRTVRTFRIDADLLHCPRNAQKIGILLYSQNIGLIKVTVGFFVEKLNISDSTARRHLAILVKNGIISHSEQDCEYYFNGDRKNGNTYRIPLNKIPTPKKKPTTTSSDSKENGKNVFHNPSEKVFHISQNTGVTPVRNTEEPLSDGNHTLLCGCSNILCSTSTNVDDDDEIRRYNELINDCLIPAMESGEIRRFCPCSGADKVLLKALDYLFFSCNKYEHVSGISNTQKEIRSLILEESTVCMYIHLLKVFFSSKEEIQNPKSYITYLVMYGLINYDTYMAQKANKDME